MKKRVLVFPCGTEIGLEIVRALKYSKHFELYVANSVDDHCKYVCEKYIELPSVDTNERLIERLNEIILKYKIDIVIPAHDSVLVLFGKHQQNIRARILGPEYETIELCRSKSKTYTYLSTIIDVPHMYGSDDTEIHYPVFLKPDKGQGAKHTFVVRNQEQLRFYTENYDNLLVLEYLPGKEYTVDCFTDNNGNLRFAKARERYRINKGISVNSKLVANNQPFYDIALKINDKIKFNGVWFFQLKKRKNGELVLLEISPRVAGTMALNRVNGVNFIELSLFNLLNVEVDIIDSRFVVEIDRALSAKYQLNKDYKVVYLDFDDTVIFDNKVNVEIIKFIYQTKNANKKIVLITKHKYDIKQTLAKYSIHEGLFDEIIVLQPTQNKSDFINPQDAIFIDDSFAERLEIYERYKIPVFSLDAIEALY